MVSPTVRSALSYARAPNPAVAGEENTVRLKLAVATGAALFLMAGTGAAAYAVVGHETVSPTIAGNNLPIDDNHSPTITPGTPEPGDDHGTTVEPGDDHGRTAEPGDDRTTGVDDGARHGGAARTTTAPAPSDDHGGSGGSGGSAGSAADDGSGHGGHGGDDGSGHH